MEGLRRKINWEPLILSWLAGGLFVYAGMLKALDPAQFASDIANYQLLPWTACAAAAVYLPWVEILAGAGLILNWNRAGALRILCFLMLLFLQALITAWARGLNIECGCFGKVFATSNYFLLLLRDAAILAALGRLLLLEWKERAAAETE